MSDMSHTTLDALLNQAYRYGRQIGHIDELLDAEPTNEQLENDSNNVWNAWNSFFGLVPTLVLKDAAKYTFMAGVIRKPYIPYNERLQRPKGY